MMHYDITLTYLMFTSPITVYRDIKRPVHVILI